MYKRTRFGFAVIALILGGCIFFLARGKFLLGIDLQGGTELTYHIDLSLVTSDVSNVAEVVKSTVANRLDGFGLKEISIAVTGGDNLVIQVPGEAVSAEVEQIKNQVESSGILDFMLAADQEYQTKEKIKEFQEDERRYEGELRGWIQAKRDFETRNPGIVYEEVKDERNELRYPKPREPDFIVRPNMKSTKLSENKSRLELDLKFGNGSGLTALKNGPNTKVSGSLLENATATYDQNGRPAVSFSFKPQGAMEFGSLTSINKGKMLAIVLDGNIREQANIKDRISERGELTGDFTREEVRGIVNLLKGGSLPTRPQLITQSSVGAVLGSDSIRSGTIAIVAGILAIFLFMLFYYVIGGAVANIAVVFNVVIILAFVVVFRQTLTFPGIAGILLTIGMAVDANILIFERVREELARGKSLLHALGTGYDRAFWVIFDSNITTILSGVVLAAMGSGPVKGFAITLIAGLVASFFTAVFVTRILLSWLYNMGWLRSMPMLKVFAPPRIDYIAIQWKLIGFTVGITALSWIFFVIPRGLNNYGIDFVGGSRITMSLSRQVEAGYLRRLIDALPEKERNTLFKDYSIQTLDQSKSQSGKASKFIILCREEEEGIARAQEKPAGESAPVPVGPAPTATTPPAAPTPAPVSPTPAAVPPAGAPAVAPPALAAATSPQGEKVSAGSRRVAILRQILAKEGLLLSDPFSEPDWEKGAAGQESLVLEVNLESIPPEFNEPGLASHETIKKRLNAQFENHSNPRIKGSDTGEFKGIRVDKVELLPAQAAGADGSIKTDRYRVTLLPYAEPIQIAGQAPGAAPSHNEVVSALKEWFRTVSPAQVKILEPFPDVQSVGPKVAQDLQGTAVGAVFVAMLGIMFYMALRFEFMYGFAGVVALFHDVLITVGLMAVTDFFFGEQFSVKINLPEFAAFLTIIGFSINDTIVVFDRVREIINNQGKKKLQFREIINAAVSQTLVRTIWTSSTTLLVTLSLLFFGGEPVRGFSYAFAIGIVTGTYSSIFIASPVVVWMHNRQVKRRAEMEAELAKV